MPDYRVLQTEVLTDPESRGYSRKTDQEVATDLNTPRIEQPSEPVLRWKMLAYLINADKLLGIMGDREHQSALIFQAFYNHPDFTVIDISDSGFQKVLDALLGDGFITAGDAEAVRAMGVKLVSKAVALAGWNIAVQAPDITYVRSH